MDPDRPAKTGADLAKAPRPRPSEPMALIERTCKICGTPTANTTGLCLTHQRQIVSAKEEQDLARAALAKNAFRYAELHMAGAEIAAQRGDTRPAEWGLLHTRAVHPVKQDAEQKGPSIVVQVGVMLPGLGNPSDPSNAPQITTNLPTPALEGEVVPSEP